jgi:hypothetical protein
VIALRAVAAIVCAAAAFGETVAPPTPLTPPGSGALGASGMALPNATVFGKDPWEDGLAEVSRFDLTQFRYGRMHPGEAVLVVVREDLDSERAVKAAPRRDESDAVVPVLKCHLVKSFQTGVYRYDQAVTTFLRRADGIPLRLFIDSHEWCGIAAKDWVNRGAGSRLRVMSYFDGHGDFEQPLELQADGTLEDALPVWLRGLDPAALPTTIAIVPTQLEARAQSTTPVSARIGARPLRETVPAGTFDAVELSLAVEGPQPAGDGVAWPDGASRRWTAVYERAMPRRLLRWRDGAGTELVLRSVERTDYWAHHRPEDAPAPHR